MRLDAEAAFDRFETLPCRGLRFGVAHLLDEGDDFGGKLVPVPRPARIGQQSGQPAGFERALRLVAPRHAEGGGGGADRQAVETAGFSRWPS